MVSIVLYLLSYITPRTGDATCALLHEVIQSWEIGGQVPEISTYNVSDVCSGVSKLLLRFAGDGQAQPILEVFHATCIVHVVYITVKDCVGMIREEIGKILSFKNSIRASVKRRDIFESVKIELGERAKFPVLEVETCWSSTSVMIKSAQATCLILNAECNRALNSSGLIIKEGNQKKASSIFNFLETDASIKELQSGTTSVTLSM